MGKQTCESESSGTGARRDDILDDGKDRASAKTERNATDGEQGNK